MSTGHQDWMEALAILPGDIARMSSAISNRDYYAAMRFAEEAKRRVELVLLHAERKARGNG